MTFDLGKPSLPAVDGKLDFNRTLGERIREARKRAAVRQDQLARAVRLSRTSITNIERGRQGVQAYLLARIAEVLGCSAADLLPGQAARSPGSIPAKVKSLDPIKREWAERVLRARNGDDNNAA